MIQARADEQNGNGLSALFSFFQYLHDDEERRNTRKTAISIIEQWI